MNVEVTEEEVTKYRNQVNNDKAYELWEKTGLLDGVDEEDAPKLAGELDSCYRFLRDKCEEFKRTNGYVLPCIARVFNHTGETDIDFVELYNEIKTRLDEMSDSLSNSNEEVEFLTEVVNDYVAGNIE